MTTKATRPPFVQYPIPSTPRRVTPSDKYSLLELTRIQQTIGEDRLEKAAEEIQNLALQTLAYDIRTRAPMLIMTISLETRKTEIVECLLNLVPERKKELVSLVQEQRETQNFARMLNLESAKEDDLNRCLISVCLQKNYYRRALREIQQLDPKITDLLKTRALLNKAQTAINQRLHRANSQNTSLFEVSDHEDPSSDRSESPEAPTERTNTAPPTPRNQSAAKVQSRSLKALKRYVTVTKPLLAVLQLGYQTPEQRVETVLEGIEKISGFLFGNRFKK